MLFTIAAILLGLVHTAEDLHITTTTLEDTAVVPPDGATTQHYHGPLLLYALH